MATLSQKQSARRQYFYALCAIAALVCLVFILVPLASQQHAQAEKRLNDAIENSLGGRAGPTPIGKIQHEKDNASWLLFEALALPALGIVVLSRYAYGKFCVWKYGELEVEIYELVAGELRRRR